MAKKDKENKAIAHPCLLIGEGTHEVEFFTVLLKELQLKDVQVDDFEGKSKLGQYLKDLRDWSGFADLRKLAITRDADDDPAGAKQSVESAITNAGLPPEVEVRYFILPGSNQKGALETLWLKSLATHPMKECVDAYFECLKKHGWEASDIWAKNDKAKAQVWLASKFPPNETIGRAASFGREKDTGVEKWIDFEHPAFDELKAFLTGMFQGQAPTDPSG